MRRHPSRAFFTVETSTGVDLVPPVRTESLAIDAARLSSRIVRGSVGVSERLANGTLARYVGMATRGEFVALEA